MLRRLWWLLPVVAAVACTGLYLEQGNAYPCDFSERPGLRDAVCQPGDVCGIDNVCRKYIYEGPRFEAGVGLTVPAYGPGSGEGSLLHPLVLKDQIEMIARDLPLGGARDSVFALTGPGRFVEVTSRGGVLTSDLVLPTLGPGSMAIELMQPFAGGLAVPQVLVQLRDGRVFIGGLGDPTLTRAVQSSSGMFRADAVRFVDLPGMPRRSLPVAWNASTIGIIARDGGDWGLSEIPELSASASSVIDVAGVTQGQRQWLVGLTNGTLAVLEPSNVDAGVLLSALPPLNAADGGMLRTDRDGRIIAAVRRGRLDGIDLDVLSTWQVSIGADGLTLSVPWPECRPCPREGQQVELLSASVASGVPEIEVICAGVGPRQALRVTGSVALTQRDACITESFEPPLSFSRFANSAPARWNNQTGLLLGGPHGEIWAGPTISKLKPVFLDRVPSDVAPVQTPGAPSIAALTDGYLAVLQTPDVLPAGNLERLNGFRRVDPRELGLTDDAQLRGFVHDTPGWGVGSNGDVVKTVLGINTATVRTGPRLVTASGEPIHDSIGGEAYVADDGGLQGFFVAADDSIYFVRDPRSFLSNPSPEVELLEPDLTPEPSVPIRSLALERTPLGTDGVTRGRGYLVTSRNVFAWQLAGNPARWSSTAIALAGGQPQEVWFDSRRSALGRVGFSDGQIYTLPGGYELAEALPADDEGTPAQVLDYENLGGWPVAYATTGVFVAGWDLVNGKLQNRFPDGGINRPMSWRELTLAGANPKPWMRDGGVFRPTEARPGRLFVSVEPPVAVDGGKEETHKLLLFLDDQVLQVARHVRYLK